MTDESVVPDDTWLIIHLPDADIRHVWNLGQPDPPTLDAAILAARTSVGFPADDNWAGAPHLSSVMVTFGRPHSNLMAAATLHTADELAKVAADQVTAYQAQLDASREQVHMDAARTVLAGLSGDQLAALLADPAVAAKVKP